MPVDARRSSGLPEIHGGERLRVLFVQHCANRTGSTISGRLVVDGFRRAGWDVEVAFGFDGPMIAEYERLGCRTHVVPHKNWLRARGFVRPLRHILAERRTASAFVRLMRDVRPDVVYVNSLVSLAGALAAHRLGLPCVWHLRELFDDVGGEMRIPRCGGRGLVRRVLTRLSTRRVAISRAVQDNILGIPEVPGTEIVPNAVADEFFELTDDVASCRRRFDLPSEVPIVGVPGTLRPMKGHSFFLDAAAIVAKLRPDVVFAITGVGEPAYTASLHRQAEELGINTQVRFLGTVTDMPRFYRACELVCVPSVAEPFGRTVIEAMAVGTPVVATAVGGMRETIDSGVTGLLVKFGDSESLSRAICEVLGNPRLSSQLRMGGLRAAQADYAARLYQERLICVVRDTCPTLRAARDGAPSSLAPRA